MLLLKTLSAYQGFPFSINALGDLANTQINVLNSNSTPYIVNITLQDYNVLQSNQIIGAVMSVTSVRLQPEIESPLEDLSKKLDRSKNYLINQAIKEFLERREIDEQRWSETIEAIGSVKSGKSVDEQAVNDWLDSWGSESEIEPPKI